MASTPLIYRLNNEPLNVKNILSYLNFLTSIRIIPIFSLNFTDTEMEIITIYSAHSTHLPLSGYTRIIYNIITKKWKSIINLMLINNEDNVYNMLDTYYPYLITNNLLRINFDNNYIEYILESDYIEDILEPSLNKFAPFDTNFRNLYLGPYMIRTIKETLVNKYVIIKEEDYNNFYSKLHEREEFILFEENRQIINNNYYLPVELWTVVYNLYRTPYIV
jgi:hypothetical protein